jgi:hypothetical protein
MSACSVRNEAVPGEVYIDFRGRPLPPEIRVSGPEKAAFIRPEPEGLRVTLPKDRYDLGAVKFDLVTAVKGDCEVTATLDILEAEEPPDELGVGVFLAINQAVRVGRMTGTAGQQAIVWERWRLPDGSRDYRGRDFACPDKARRLQLKRTGEDVHFLWSPSAKGNDLREIGQCEFGDQDVTLVRLIAQTGQRPCRLDVRFVDLRVAGPSVALGHWRPWLPAAIGVGGLIVIAALVAVRRRMRKPVAT